MSINLVKKWFELSQLVLAMLLVQLFSAGMQLLSRVILIDGTFVFALMAYRNLVAALCVAPLAFFFERHQEKKFGWQVWLWIFLTALSGALLLELYYYGLRDTTATYASIFLSSVPIVTFFLSIITRMEKLQLQRRAGKMKCVGALLCVGGALTFILYKGIPFHIGHHHHHIASNATANQSHLHWARGTILLVGACLSYAIWCIVQVKLLKVFPLKYWGSMLQCLLMSLQSAVIGLCLNTNTNAWKLGWNLHLLTIIYSGALSSAATFCLISWAISKQGPTYPPIFNPVSLIFVAVLECFILGEAITPGILIAMVLIIVGLYSFLWGKRNETNCVAQQNAEEAEEQGRLSTSGPIISQFTSIVVLGTTTTLQANISDIDADEIVDKNIDRAQNIP